MSTRVVKVDKVTREVLRRYGSIVLAAECNELSSRTIDYMIRSGSVGNGKFYFRREDEFDPFEVFRGKQGLPVLVIDRGVERMFHTMTEAAESMHYTTASLGGIASGKYRKDLVIRFCREPVRGFAKCL